MPHLIDASQDFPHGMTAQKIVHPPPVQPLGNTRALSTSARPMMEADFLAKDLGLPSLRPRTERRDEVDTPGSQWSIAADGFKASPPEHLARPLHIPGAERIVADHVSLSERCACHP